MSDGIEEDEPHGPKYCEVIQIGIDDNTAEVTIFYTPHKGKLAVVKFGFYFKQNQRAKTLIVKFL